jgi:hypothetical protein
MPQVCVCCETTVGVKQVWICRVCHEQALGLVLLPGGLYHRQLMLDGIAKAKAAGKYKGRPPSIDAAKVRRLSATMRPTEIARRLGVARSSIYRLLGGRTR